MKLSARNVISGTVVSVTHGPVSAAVAIDIGHGVTITSSITDAAAADLDLKPGDAVSAIIKSSDVLIGK